MLRVEAEGLRDAWLEAARSHQSWECAARLMNGCVVLESVWPDSERRCRELLCRSLALERGGLRVEALLDACDACIVSRGCSMEDCLRIGDLAGGRWSETLRRSCSAVHVVRALVLASLVQREQVRFSRRHPAAPCPVEAVDSDSSLGRGLCVARDSSGAAPGQLLGSAVELPVAFASASFVSEGLDLASADTFLESSLLAARTVAHDLVPGSTPIANWLASHRVTLAVPELAPHETALWQSWLALDWSARAPSAVHPLHLVAGQAGAVTWRASTRVGAAASTFCHEPVRFDPLTTTSVELQAALLPRPARLALQLLCSDRCALSGAGDWCSSDPPSSCAVHVRRWWATTSHQLEALRPRASSIVLESARESGGWSASAALAAVCRNSFCVRVESAGVDAGGALYAHAALANHACDPSADARFDSESGGLLLVAKRAMCALEAVTICYSAAADLHIEPNAGRRREALLASHWFLCECVHCQSTSGRKTSLRSPFAAGGWLVAHPDATGVTLVCSVTGRALDDSDARDLAARASAARSSLRTVLTHGAPPRVMQRVLESARSVLCDDDADVTTLQQVL